MICECCKKYLKNKMGGQKYCPSCSLFTKELRRQVTYWKGRTKRLRRLYYGEKDGKRLR